MDSDQKHSRPSERFERGLTTLLKKAYTPVEARSDFKHDLLDRLRQKQTITAKARSARRRRSNIIFLASSGLAASLILCIGLALHNPVGRVGADTGTGQERGVFVFAPPPSDLPEATAGKSADHLASSSVSPATIATYGLIPEHGWTGRVSGTIEMRDASGAWRAADSAIALGQSTAIRIPAGRSGAIHLAPTVVLEMAGNSQLRIGDGQMTIERGLMMFDVVPGSDPVHLTVQDKDILLEGGSRLVLAQPGDGATAKLIPGVVLVKGVGTMSTQEGAQHAMRAGTAYRFDSNVTREARIPEIIRPERGETGENPVLANWLSPER